MHALLFRACGNPERVCGLRDLLLECREALLGCCHTRSQPLEFGSEAAFATLTDSIFSSSSNGHFCALVENAQA
jgi:hypothetical protein